MRLAEQDHVAIGVVSHMPAYLRKSGNAKLSGRRAQLYDRALDVRADRTITPAEGYTPPLNFSSKIGAAPDTGVYASMLNRSIGGRYGGADRYLIPLQRQYGNRFVQRWLNGRTPDIQSLCLPDCRPRESEQVTDTEVVPYAAKIVTARYPHLAKVMSADQMDQIQKALNADFELEKVLAQQNELRKRGRLYFQGNRLAGGLSSDVARYESFQGKINKLAGKRDRNLKFQISSKLLLADDVKSAGSLDFPRVVAYHKELYKRVTEYPIQVIVDPYYATHPDRYNSFIKYYWMGGVDWQFPNDDGLVRFDDLLTAQKFRLDYLQALTGDQVEILGKMIEIARDVGETYTVTGKKLGEIYRWYWSNKDISIGYEIGDLGGYRDDPRGQWRMTNDLYGKKGKGRSRVVLRSPGGWLHIRKTKPRFASVHLSSPDDDGYVYLLTKNKDAGLHIVEVITSDERHLSPGSTKSGPGWRTEEELTGFEQFAIGVIIGDAFEETTASSFFGQFITGLIPIVGQIADARDVAIGMHKIWTSGGKDGKLQTALAFVGFVPALGDYIKSIAKPGKEAAGQAVEKAVRKFGGQVEDTAGQELKLATEKGGKSGALERIGKAEDVKSSFVKQLRKEASKSTDELSAGLKKTAEPAGDVAEAVGHQLPNLEKPMLVASAPVRFGGADHLIKIVRIGNWKQIWLCSNCGSLIGRIDETLESIAKSGIGKSKQVSDSVQRLKGIREDALKLEKQLNAGKRSEAAVSREVKELAADMRKLARKHPDLGGMNELLERSLRSAYEARYPGGLSGSSKMALSKGYEPTPPGYKWYYNGATKKLEVRSIKGGPQQRYLPDQHIFAPHEGGKVVSKVFEKGVSAQKAFKELGGLDAATDFGKFVKVLQDHLGIRKKELVDRLGNRKKIGGLTHDTVRSSLKAEYRERLFNHLIDPSRLARTETYKRVLKESGDPRLASRAASHERFVSISEKLGSADKGSLGEKWFNYWFVLKRQGDAADEIATQIPLEKLIPGASSRRLDVFEDHLLREVKNVSESLGADGAKQLSDMLSHAGKPIKIKGSVTGFDSVRYAFVTPAGSRANAGWIADQLTAHPKASLSFQVFNAKGASMVISHSDLKAHGHAGLRRIIEKWAKPQNGNL